MMLDPQEWLQIDFMRGHATEPLTAALFVKLLCAGDTLIDVGAHVGWLSLIGAKAVGETGKVIAVDPQPYNCDRILANAQLNGFRNLAVVAGAAGEMAGPVRLSNQSTTDKARLTLEGPGVNDTGVEFLTHVYSLTQLIDIFEISSVRLLKVDVEGFEMSVFRGAAPVLDRIDNIIFEHLPENAGNFSILRDLLTDAGFDLLTVNGERLGGEAPPEHNIWARRIS
jgi:FkbM family methyltransferase